MPDHIHLCVRKHRDSAETMIAHFQEASRNAVIDLKIRHFDHPVWGGGGWKVFLDSPEDVTRTVKYVEDNPIKARLTPQDWSFVSRYDNWPFHKRR
ncbi:MAG TPA: hypothetical protein VLJ39_21905 [Tepidisphaeraceae bacterium]|jgi:REP element-mobilizing transposase RayT|nr:hypothetical protein [Tepidisphaeraceae bacterium]